MKQLKEQVQEAVAFLQSRLNQSPAIGVITGTGLGSAGGELEDAMIIDYGEIPHFPVSTVVGHSGQLAIGKLSGRQLW